MLVSELRWTLAHGSQCVQHTTATVLIITVKPASSLPKSCHIFRGKELTLVQLASNNQTCPKTSMKSVCEWCRSVLTSQTPSCSDSDHRFMCEHVSSNNWYEPDKTFLREAEITHTSTCKQNALQSYRMRNLATGFLPVHKLEFEWEWNEECWGYVILPRACETGTSCFLWDEMLVSCSCFEGPRGAPTSCDPEEGWEGRWIGTELTDISWRRGLWISEWISFCLSVKLNPLWFTAYLINVWESGLMGKPH